MLHRRGNFLWTELLSKAVLRSLLIVFSLLLVSQINRLQNGFFSAPSKEIPAVEGGLEEIPFYR